MTVARAAGFGALLLVVVLAAYLLVFRGSGGHEYTLVFQNAGQLVKDDDVQIGGRAVGSVRDDQAHRDNQAAIKVERRGAVRAAARGHAGDDPADVAVGHRQPLRRAHARARTARRTLADGATLDHRLDDHGRSTSTSSSTRSTRRRAGPAGRHQGLRDPVRRQGQGGRRSRPSTSTRCCRRRARLVNELDAGRGRADRASSSTPRARSPRSPSAATTSPALVGNANATAGAIAQRERRALAGAGAAADDAAARQLDVREPARDARRPRPAGRRRPSPRRRTSRRSCASCARSCTTRGRRSADLARCCAGPGPTTTSSTPRASCRRSEGRQPGVRARHAAR